MLKKEVVVNRNKAILDIYINKYNHKINLLDRYKRQIDYYNDELCKKELIIQTNIEKVDNIMIVAHPDDETIFGSKELHNGKWLLIVCTNSMDGRIGIMRKDIPGLIQMSKDYKFNLVVIQHFDMYEEKIINTRFDITVYYYIKEYLLNQSWNKIITHNKDGEYGHNQHILVHRMVSNILCNNNILYNKFKVFDFNDNVNNDHLIVKSIIKKYYLMEGNNLLELRCDKVCIKDEIPVNYDMTHILCI